MEVFALSNHGLKVPKKSLMQGKLNPGKKLKGNKAIIALIITMVITVSGYFFIKYPFKAVLSDTVNNSIAVLPFDDMSTNHDQGFLSDGVAEEIIDRLSKFNELKVVARTSSFSFRNKDQDIKSIGKKLNVTNILEGSVQKNESKIKITVRLTNSQNGFTLFSKSYTDELENIFDLQSRIAIDVASTIEDRLSPGGKTLQNRRRINPQAYETFLKGKSQFVNGPLNMAPGETRIAKKYFGAAADLDATFTEAFSYLALAYFNLADWALPRYDTLGIKTALDSAMMLSKKAIDLDSLNSAAHLAIGSYYFHQYNWIEAEREKRKAVQLNPGGTEEKFTLASFLSQFGQADEALKLDEEALSLDPLDLNSKLKYVRDLFRARKYDQCIEQCKAILKEKPNSSGAYQFLGYCYYTKKMYEESRMAWYQNFKLIGDSITANFYYYNDFKTALKKRIAFLEKENPKPILHLVHCYAQSGDKDNTFKCLYEMLDLRMPQISFITQDFFDFLKQDPRYYDFIEKAGFKEYYEFKDIQLNRVNL
jgi:TolB-like protein/Flp pilus assembly protein TadD